MYPTKGKQKQRKSRAGKPSSGGDPASDRLRVGRSRTGLGLFAVAPIRRGEFIVEYWGKRFSSAQAYELRTKYLFDLNGRWVIDGSDRRNTARYINHACKPNSIAQVERGSILIYAKENISAGDEITCNYGKQYFDVFLSAKGCRCAVCEPARRAPRKPAQGRT